MSSEARAPQSLPPSSTSPPRCNTIPPTAILIAHTVAARLRLPYVIDFRDSWTAFHHAPQRPAWLAELERRLERRMIRHASAVVAVDSHIVEHAYSRIPLEDRPPLHEIQNGYDEDDFAGVDPAPLPRFSIVHTGQLRRPPLALWEGCGRPCASDPSCTGMSTCGRSGSWSPAPSVS